MHTDKTKTTFTQEKLQPITLAKTRHLQETTSTHYKKYNLPVVEVSVNADVRVAVAAVLVDSVAADVAAAVPEVVLSVDAAVGLLPVVD